ncbi:hypothetical protein IQ264_15065 [Phormidium sp. LEGE 05292]|uniref:hypothetical protein n=1 Tax=[Phormidium] sp. LEGE 05292 TaxID=767427 RepID=UPI0018809172|nr:hypothetical protein [Phormidium sp. LEGE 05292]MBE9226747.1 hypothetical protein [Phormidium sp. LEGE 05292]
MLKNSCVVGFLTVATLSLFPLTARATDPCCQRVSTGGGDNAVIQTSRQQSHVSGSHNSTNQISSQSSNNAIGRGTRGNQGVVQDQFQDASSSGFGNRVNQVNRQNSSNRNAPAPVRGRRVFCTQRCI